MTRDLILIVADCATGEVMEGGKPSGLQIGAGWQPIETAPKTGMPETILLWVPELHGTGGPVLAHWAFGGGDEQPAFGPSWFYWSGYQFNELPRGHKPTHWMHLPVCPADWRKSRPSRVDLTKAEVKLPERIWPANSIRKMGFNECLDAIQAQMKGE